MNIEEKIKSFLKTQGIQFLHFADLSHLDKTINRGFPNAVLVGVSLTPEYVYKVSGNPDYVEDMKRRKQIEHDQFHLMEIHTDKVADKLAEYIRSLGYSALSQSEKTLSENGLYNPKIQLTPLPHKTVAGIAGLGWIGKHNLLVTAEYGSAISMCTVLTDVHLPAVSKQALPPQCGSCSVCVDICATNAIKGRVWSISSTRDQIFDYSKCTSCIQCMMHCPFTQKYMKKHLEEERN